MTSENDINYGKYLRTNAESGNHLFLMADASELIIRHFLTITLLHSSNPSTTGL